jgi:hypothetical protein
VRGQPGGSVCAGLDELLVVEGDAAAQPGSVGARAGHEEDALDAAQLARSGCRIAPADALEVRAAFQRNLVATAELRFYLSIRRSQE